MPNPKASNKKRGRGKKTNKPKNNVQRRKVRKGKKNNNSSQNNSVIPVSGHRKKLFTFIQDSQLTTSSGGTFATDFMNVNNAFEPYGTNKIPGFSLMADVLSMYRVLSGTLEIEVTTFNAPIAAGTISADVILLMADSNFPSISQGGNAHTSITVQSQIIPHVVRGVIGAPGTNICKLKLPFNPVKVFGLPKSDPGYRAATNAAPVNLVYAFWAVDSSGAVAATIQTYNVVSTLKVWVEFSEPIYTLSSVIDRFDINRSIQAGASLNDLPLRACAPCQYLELHQQKLCNCKCEAPCPLCCFTRPCTERFPIAGCPLAKQTIKLKSPLLKRTSRESLVSAGAVVTVNPFRGSSII